jgi:hypothetical protein
MQGAGSQDKNLTLLPVGSLEAGGPPPQQDERPVYKKGWFWGVPVGGVVIVGVGLGVGLSLGLSSGSSFDANLPKGGPGIHAAAFPFDTQRR